MVSTKDSGRHFNLSNGFKIMVTVFLLLFSTYYSSVTIATVCSVCVISVRTLNSAGIAQTTFSSGELVLVEVRIESNAQGTALIIVQVMHNHEIAWVDFEISSVSPDTRFTVYLGSPLPSTAALGTYTASVYIWNGFITSESSNWIALSPVNTTNFTVV